LESLLEEAHIKLCMANSKIREHTSRVSRSW
jgi:hypothetical protein